MSASIVPDPVREAQVRRSIAEVLAAPGQVRLHLGSGLDKKAGYVNVDIDESKDPDLAMDIDELHLFPDASVDRIESYHLFEHLHHTQAVAALRTFHRILRPGGEVVLELPNLAACLRELGKHFDEAGRDLAMIGMFGYPPDVDADGIWQVHKWGWNPETLGAALVEAGFASAAQHPVDQSWRPAARFGRDMQVRGTKAGATSTVARDADVSAGVASPTLTADLRRLLEAAPEADAEVAVIIVNRDRPDLTDALVEALASAPSRHRGELFVVDAGCSPEGRSQYASVRYDDPDFSGKCFAHNVGLRHAIEASGRFRYYFFLMNDIVLDVANDPIASLIDALESDPRMGIVSPTELDSGYPASRPEPGRAWHKVSTSDYLALMVRGECLEEVGFLNPAFRYSWGAIHELSHQAHRHGWFLAYSDTVTMRHLGGTTYGATTATISRAQYQENAKRWAADYFRAVYGETWDEDFSRLLPPEVAVNTYTHHREAWEAVAPAS